MKYFIVFVSLVAVIIFTYLAWMNKNWESVAALIVSIGTLLSVISKIFTSCKQEKNTQSIGNNSTGIQAGRDVNIYCEKGNK